MEGSEVLGLQKLITRSSCAALENVVEPRSILALMNTSQEMRDLVRGCVTKIMVPEGQGVNAEFILSLPVVRRVEGVVVVTRKEDVDPVSHQVRGSLLLQSIHSERDHWAQISDINYRATSALKVRMSLYPSSTFQYSYIIHRRYAEEGFVRYETGTLSFGGTQRVGFELISSRLHRVNFLGSEPSYTNPIYQSLCRNQISSLGFKTWSVFSNLLKRSQEIGCTPKVHDLFFMGQSEDTVNLKESLVERYSEPLAIHGVFVTDLEDLQEVLSVIPNLTAIGLEVSIADFSETEPWDVVRGTPISDELTLQERSTFLDFHQRFPNISFIPYRVHPETQ